MAQEESCLFCGYREPEASLVTWIVQSDYRAIHTNCWLEAYGRNALELEPSTGAQDAAG